MKKKEVKKVYVLVKRSKDVSSEFVKILGIYFDRQNAEQSRQDCWDELQIESSVEAYFVLDQNLVP